MEDWLAEFKAQSIFRMDESERMLGICVSQFSEAAFWHTPNPASNSIGNLLLHLSGNIRQYVISGVGGAPDTRNRDAEFSTSKRPPKEAVWKEFCETLEDARRVIRNTSEAGMLKRRSVQGFDLSGMGMILHAVEHLSYHTGQIAFALKYRQGKPLGFYDGTDLNRKNEEAC